MALEIADKEKQKKAGSGIAAAVKLLIKKWKESKKNDKKKGREKLLGGD